MEEVKNTKETFSSKCGHIIANVLVGCITACISAVLITLTVKFITLIM